MSAMDILQNTFALTALALTVAGLTALKQVLKRMV